MNLSGRSVGQALRFYKLEPADLLVVCDDLSLPLGKLRLRPGGSDGGQKGLRDIIAHLGTDQFPRLRIGIGERGELDAADFVLSRFRSAERPDHRRHPDPRHPGRRRLGHPGHRCAMNRFNGAAAANESVSLASSADSWTYVALHRHPITRRRRRRPLARCTLTKGCSCWTAPRRPRPGTTRSSTSTTS